MKTVTWLSDFTLTAGLVLLPVAGHAANAGSPYNNAQTNQNYHSQNPADQHFSAQPSGYGTPR
jgi:hypothetical protein